MILTILLTIQMLSALIAATLHFMKEYGISSMFAFVAIILAPVIMILN